MITHKLSFGEITLLQEYIATLTDINAMAVVSYSNITELTTKSLIQVSREINWKIKIFNEREVALQWLQDQQQLRLME
jgi:hypothetical protein